MIRLLCDPHKLFGDLCRMPKCDRGQADAMPELEFVPMWWTVCLQSAQNLSRVVAKPSKADMVRIPALCLCT